MKISLLSIVLAGCASASAGPNAPAPGPAAPPAACAATGTPIVEIDHEVVHDAPLPTSQTKVFASGAWQTTGKDDKGKPVPAQSGCLDKAALATITADLKAAPWTIKHNRFHCMMVGQTFTVYKVNGKQVWLAKICNPDTLDDASTKSIASIESTLVAAKAMAR